MTEYDDELQHGRALATTTATASADLDREAQRIGAIAGKPVAPDTAPAARSFASGVRAFDGGADRRTKPGGVSQG